jgi:DNA-binding IclR family transcriptional regulator
MTPIEIRIIRALRSSPAQWAEEEVIARRAGLHLSVTRATLTRLEEGGVVERTFRRLPGGDPNARSARLTEGGS